MNVHETPSTHHPVPRRHPWWRSPLLGYPSAVLLAAGAFLMHWSERSMGLEDYFVASPFVIATLLVGWFWGIGPALLALVLEALALDYWIVPPAGNISFFLWPDIVSFAPFIVLQLLVLGLIVAAKRNYQQQIQRAHQALSQRAEELAESNIRLAQADQVKDRFLSLASHELKTPLTAIQGSLQLILRQMRRQSVQNPDLLPFSNSLGKVEQQTRQFTDLVNDLLDLTILRGGKMPIRLTSYDLCALGRQTVEEQRSLTERQIAWEGEGCPLLLDMDERRIAQVIVNLVSNALKYSPADTIVRMTARRTAREAILAVHNELPVLSEDQQRHLFEPFYRSPEAHSSPAPGWGLGLAVCQEIVTQHGGQIRVESSEKKGTTFVIVLPIPAALVPPED